MPGHAMFHLLSVDVSAHLPPGSPSEAPCKIAHLGQRGRPCPGKVLWDIPLQALKVPCSHLEGSLFSTQRKRQREGCVSGRYSCSRVAVLKGER